MLYSICCCSFVGGSSGFRVLSCSMRHCHVCCKITPQQLDNDSASDMCENVCVKSILSNPRWTVWILCDHYGNFCPKLSSTALCDWSNIRSQYQSSYCRLSGRTTADVHLAEPILLSRWIGETSCWNLFPNREPGTCLVLDDHFFGILHTHCIALSVCESLQQDLKICIAKLVSACRTAETKLVPSHVEQRSQTSVPHAYQEASCVVV